MRVIRHYSGPYTADSLHGHYAGASPTMAVCVKITPQTGSAIGFTTASFDISGLTGHSGVTFRNTTGVAASQLETAGGTHASNIELTTILSANGITEAELNTPKWQGAEVDAFLINYEAPTMGQLVLPVSGGRLADFKIQVPLTVTSEARGINNALLNSFGRVTAPLCVADFGDSWCKLDLVALGYVKTGHLVTNVGTATVFVVAGLAGVGVDYFKNGKVLFTDGPNTGLPAFEVKSFDNSTGEFTLHRATPYPVVVGVTVTATRGCQKRLADCSGYNNIANNRSFPFVPLEKALRVVEAGQ